MTVYDIVQAAAPLPEARDALADLVGKHVSTDQDGRVTVRDEFGAPRFHSSAPGCPEVTVLDLMAEMRESRPHWFDADAKAPAAPEAMAAPVSMTEAMMRAKTGDKAGIAYIEAASKPSADLSTKPTTEFNLTKQMIAASKGDKNAMAAIIKHARTR